MARPKLPPSERKTHRIVFRLTDQEYLPLDQKAAAQSIPTNELARQLTLSKIEKLVVEAQTGANPALLKQLHYIGHNLNQLVKNAHIFGRVSPRIEQLCQRIDTLMDKTIEKEIQ